MTIALLPEEDRAAIKAGASVKRILEKKALADKRRKMQERIATDKKTGEISNHIADTILEFCRTVKGVPETPIREYEVEFFLGETRNELRELESRGVHGIRFPKRFNLRKRFKLTRPPDEVDDSWMGKRDAESWMGHRAKWLANLLLAEAAEKPIRERAIVTAGKRSKELRIKMTQKEMYKHTVDRLAWIANGPPLRKHWY
jgi:hypothetical protein